MKRKYYSLEKILSRNAIYNMIIGERSNGKTYAVLNYGIKKFAEDGSQIAIIRRWSDDFKQKRASTMFDTLVANGEVANATAGEWTDIYYYAGKWYFCRHNGDDRIVADRPFAYAFSISSMEHDKSTSYPFVRTVLFDEFLSRTYYLPDEFVLFMNVLSTIIRDRSDVTIFMCGNTVSKTCPYFSEMGLKHVKDMRPGDIDVYKYGESKLTVAVEFCAENKHGKPSDVYFSFDNPRLNMITGTGSIWEMDVYPHLPAKYNPNDILFTYFIIFDGEILQCEIIQKDDTIFTFIHRKTTPIQDPKYDIIFTPTVDSRPNWFRNITKPTTELQRKLYSFFRDDRVFYQDNEVGEIVRSYLLWCK